MKLLLGDCKEKLKDLATDSVDAIVADPPYELGFMGKGWDSSGIAYDVEMWSECWRVLKPGGYLLAFGGSRTYHRMACAIEDAQFQIRDQIQWIYSSGFPKSHDVSKAIDKAAGAEREVIGIGRSGAPETHSLSYNMSKGGSQEMGGEYDITKPATPEAKQWEGWGTALKPAHEPIVMARKPFGGTVAENVLEHGTGAINIDDCRTENSRFPANIILDEEAGAMLGGASRFFYCPKASKAERNEGCENHHPTVKPVALMRYLCRLVCPPGGVVLDPFLGSGTTGVAASLEDFDFIGIEMEEEYMEITRHRIAHHGKYNITDEKMVKQPSVEWI